MPVLLLGGLGMRIAIGLHLQSTQLGTVVSCAAATVFWCESWCVCVYLYSVPTWDYYAGPNSCPRHVQFDLPTPEYLWTYRVGCESVTAKIRSGCY